MNKGDWEKLYEILNNCYCNFRTDYHNSKNGKNKKIIERASYNVDNEISLAIRWIEKYPESFDLMTGENATEYDKAIVWDKFIRPNWFNVDMPTFLERIKVKIESIE
ncbi:hypothetical protein [Ascidiimonas aurantiaca]|uniref:hypothetical protein n=1 Tax=Ascidiimonas aurantiaca TaxID=1685432 RepID=UPI0030ED2FB1